FCISAGFGCHQKDLVTTKFSNMMEQRGATMRSIKITQVNRNIATNRKKANAAIFKERAQHPRIRRLRSRSEDERKALTKITRASVERAKREGKMKMIGKRRMYYDPSE